MAWIYGDYGIGRLYRKNVNTPFTRYFWETSGHVVVFYTTARSGAGGNRPNTLRTKTTWAFATGTGGIGGSGGFNIPATKEFWLRFDVYYKPSITGTDPLKNGFFVGNAPYGDAHHFPYVTGYTGILVNSSKIQFYNYDSENYKYQVSKGFPKQSLRTCLLHMKSGTTNGLCEFWVDGELFFTYAGDVNNGANFNCIGVAFIISTGFVGQDVYFSRVLISNEQIGFDYPTVHWYEIVNEDVARNIIEATEVNVDVDVVREIVDCVFNLDVERNISAELIFSPLETEEIFHGASSALKLKSGLRASGTITARSFDSNEIEQNTMSERNTSGTQSVEINIAEQQLTDQVTFTSIIKYNIMQYISGQYFDYNYKFCIESKSQQGILHTYHCCSNIDQLLYTQFFTKARKTEVTVKDNGDGTQTVTISNDEGNSEETIGGGSQAESASTNTGEVQIIFDTDTEYESAAEERRLLETEDYDTLEGWAVVIANTLGLTPIIQFVGQGDYEGIFSSIGKKDLHGRTYADIIREVYGWSARIPHLMINVYIRDDKLFVVQRGSERNVIDITQTKHTVPIIQEELVRMAWGSTPYSSTTITKKTIGTQGGNGYEKPNESIPSGESEEEGGKDNVWSGVGTVTTSNSAGTSITKYDYSSNGVLMGTTTTFTSNGDASQNSTTVVKNSYNSDGLLESVTTTVTHSTAPENDTQTVVNYGYLTLADGRKFLANELTAEYERNEKGFFELADTKTTAKSPTGRGQGTSYDSKGKGTASSNIGDDRITPYQLRSAFNTTTALSQQTLEEKTTKTINGFYDVDPSFPLLLKRDRNLVTSALEFLNRSIKVTASLTIYDFAHIIDFNDRILLDGEEYFLANNTVKTAPRIYNEQNLTLVRWYRQIGEVI